MLFVRYCRGCLAALLLALLPACENSKNQSAPLETPSEAASTADAAAPPYLSHAQPRLQTIALWVGPNALKTELALTRTEIATGMMYRRQMDENDGMLFVFGEPFKVSFYMKNTYVPLSCAYIDSDGIIREIHDMKPLDESPIEAATDAIQYVLEVKQGWFQRHHVAPGVAVATERGSLRQTFFAHAPP